MRVQKIALAALSTAVAGLVLTACQDGDDSASAASEPPPAQSSQAQGSASPGPDAGSGGNGGKDDGGGSDASPSASAGTSTGGDAGSKPPVAGDLCKTANLGFSTSGGMAEGNLIVHLKNNGTVTCTLKGFPGADVRSKDGTVSATRTDLSAPKVVLKPGEETRFTLHFPRNDSGGSGVTFTSLVVTPPNETHSRTLPINVNVPVKDVPGSGVRVDPVGTGK